MGYIKEMLQYVIIFFLDVCALVVMGIFEGAK